MTLAPNSHSRIPERALLGTVGNLGQVNLVDFHLAGFNYVLGHAAYSQNGEDNHRYDRQ